MPHGFDVSDELHRQLRGPIPLEAVAWLEQQTGSRVIGSRPLEGGQSAAIHRVALDGHEDVVLRRFVLDWILEEPWAPANEALVLGLLRDAPVPAPTVIAADPSGRDAGVPTVLMSALPGTVVWDPPKLDPWLDALIDTMRVIHSIPAAPELSEWEAYAPQDAPPAWTQHRRAWESAIATYEDERRPRGDRVFLHRDFHPGNILWHEGSVSGVVDWVSSCVGPAEEDVSHCRVNLAKQHGQAVADHFLNRWLSVNNRSDYHPYWDLLAALSMSGDDPDPRLDEFVAAAAARL